MPLAVLPHSQFERESLRAMVPDAESAPHLLLVEHHSQVRGALGGAVGVVLVEHGGPPFALFDRRLPLFVRVRVD